MSTSRLPVVGEAEHLELALEGRDVLERGRARVRAGLDRVLLGGKAERVPAHRMEDVEAAHALVARDDVGRGVALGVPDVEPGARRVREHVEHVRLRACPACRSARKVCVLVPVPLPLGLDGRRIVPLAHRLDVPPLRPVVTGSPPWAGVTRAPQRRAPPVGRCSARHAPSARCDRRELRSAPGRGS